MSKTTHRHTRPTSSGRVRSPRNARTVTRARGARHAVFALAALLALGGCSDGAGRATPTTPPPTTPAATPSATSSVTDAFFSTPSKNIGCYVERTGVRCDIAEHTWRGSPRPADCDGDWGAGLTLHDEGKVSVGLCTTDSALGAERILAYGESVQVGPYRCASEPDGVTCVHAPTEEGFFLSRTAYRVLATSFVSPSGNLACEIGLEYVECAVKDHTWHAPDGTEDCGKEHAGVEFFDGATGFTCLDEPHFEPGQVLEYGGTAAAHGKRCTVEREGVTCLVGTRGRGFFLSRSSYRFL